MVESSPAAPSQPESASAKTRHDFSQLARRIAGWTTNGLATALVLLAGMTLGRQVLLWWGETPAAPAAAHRDDAGKQEAGLRHLEFGALATSIQTRPVRGSRDDVLRHLRELCRPAARLSGPWESPADAAERRLLASLAGKEPAESGDGWRIDQFPQELPLVVCSTWAGVLSPERDSFRSENGLKSVLPLPLDLRIISIGLAVPAAEGEWTAYAFRVDGNSPAVDGQSHFPLPDGSHRGLTLKQPDGSVLMTFRGAAEAVTWEEHFRTTLKDEGWQIQDDPEAIEGRWHAEFAMPGPKPLRAQVHFEYDRQGELHGLLLVEPDSET